MPEYRLSQALGNISDDLLLEATQLPKKRAVGKIARRLVAVAAVIAILLTALLWSVSDENYVTSLGGLVVYAYSLEKGSETEYESVILEEGVEFTPYVQYNNAISYRRDFPFSFSVDESLYPGMTITLEISTNAGIFYKMEPYDPDNPIWAPGRSAIEQALGLYYGQHFTVDIDKKIYWLPNGFDYAYMKHQFEQGNLDYESAHKWHWFSENPSFFSVIIRADEYIIGYCVIEIREINGVTGYSAQDFSFEVLTMVSFPKVDGEWQEVTLKYVQEQINNIQTEREELK